MFYLINIELLAGFIAELKYRCGYPKLLSMLSPSFVSTEKDQILTKKWQQTYIKNKNSQCHS